MAEVGAIVGQCLLYPMGNSPYLAPGRYDDHSHTTPLTNGPTYLYDNLGGIEKVCEAYRARLEELVIRKLCVGHQDSVGRGFIRVNVDRKGSRDIILQIFRAGV
jgi:hypothetical protein